ncbi:MAG: hypothetical protein HY437_02585 [Candidatus Magasanikbacteria bacterium]|nr:hypothetical protein [Candidatus Magasanikbacteria bacterium]
MDAAYLWVGKIVVWAIGWCFLGLVLTLVIAAFDAYYVDRINANKNLPLGHLATLGPMFDWLGDSVKWADRVFVWFVFAVVLMPVFFLPGLVVAIIWEFRRRLEYARYVRTERAS